MKIKWLLLGICLSVAIEAKSTVLKIDDLVGIALKHSPDIDIKRLDFKGAEQRMRAAQSFYLPRLDLEVNGGKQYSKLKNQTSSNVDILVGSLGASQLLYDFGKTQGRISSSLQESFALEAQMQQTISDKIFLVKQSYYEILKIKSIIDVQHKNVQLQKQQLHRATRYLSSGIKTIIDVSDAQVQVEQAQLDLKNTEYQLELQRAQLEEILGVVPYAGKYLVYSKKLNMKNLSRQLPRVDTSLSQLEVYAYRHRYVLESSEYYVKGAQANVDVSTGEYYPTLALKGSYTAQHVDNSVVGITPEKQGQVAVNMTWNLFSGYQTDASVQEAKIGVLKASSQVESIKLSIKREVLESHIGVRQSKDNVRLTEKISHASFQKFKQAQKRYENELSDYVELQDAQQGYIQSLSDLVNAYYDYFIAMAQLDHAVGK
jgi:outer membrane protein